MKTNMGHLWRGLLLTAVWLGGWTVADAATLLGNTGVGASHGAPGANTVRGGYFLCTATGTIDHIQIYTSNSSGNVQVGVYSVNANKFPVTRLGSSASTAITNGWNAIPLTSPVPVQSGTYYHVAFSFSAGASVHFHFTDNTTGQGMITKGSWTYGTLPDPFGNTTDSAGGRACSIYATGSAGTPVATLTPTRTPLTPGPSLTPTRTPTATTGGVLMGNTGVGASHGAPGANTVRGGYFLCTATGTIDRIHIYTSNSSGNAQVGVYSVNANKFPTARLGSSASTAIANGWNTIPLTSPVPVQSGTTYHLDFAFSAGASVHFHFADNTTGQGMITKGSWTYGTLPDPFGNTTDSAGGRACSIYASGSGGTPPVTATRTPAVTLTPTRTPLTPAPSPTQTPTATTGGILMGNTGVGASHGAPGANTVRGGYFLCTATGTIDRIHIYTSNSSGNVQVGVYSVNAGNFPTARLGSSASTAITNGWNAIPLTSPVPVQSGNTYHLDFACSAGDSVHFHFADNTTGQGMITKGSWTYGTLPDPFGNTTDSAGGQACSIYASGFAGTPAGTATRTPVGTATNTPALTLTSTPTGMLTPLLTPTATRTMLPGETLIGNAAVGASHGAPGANTVRGGHFLCTETGFINYVRIYTSNSSGTALAGIYSVDANKQPVALLGSSAGTPITDGWNAIPLTAPVQITGGTYYHLAFSLSAGDSVHFHFTDNVAGQGMVTRGGWTYGTLPDPFGSPTDTATSRECSIYGIGILATATVTPVVTITPTRTATATPPGGSVITTFQPGHGFTPSGSGTMSDDTDDYVIGEQSLKFVTSGNGAIGYVQKTGIGPYNFEGKLVRIWVKLSKTGSDLNYASLYLSSDNFASNSIEFNVGDVRINDSMQPKQANTWVALGYFWREGEESGDVDRSAINAIRFQVRDKGDGAVTARLNEIAMVEEPEEGAVTFTVDDGYSTQYTLAKPILDRYGFRATAYIIPDLLGMSNYITLAQARAFKTDSGWEVSSHYQSDLTLLSASQVESVLHEVYDFMIANGFEDGVQDFAYPSGMLDEGKVLPVVKKYFGSGRLVTEFPETIPPIDPYKIRAYSVEASTTVSQVKARIDYAKNNHEWLILVFHKFHNTTKADYLTWLTSEFEEIVAYVQQSGVPVKTMAEVLNEQVSASSSKKLQPAASAGATSPIPTPTATPTPVLFSQSQRVAEEGVLAYPQPATQRVNFAYAADGPVTATIDVYTVVGEQVAHLVESKPGGSQPQITVWQTDNVGSGIYYYRIEIKNASGSVILRKTRKLAVLK